MNIVITGHVDHGKSTLIGRLLSDTESLPQGKLESVKSNCHKNGRVFEYSMLLDALEDEQKQGITIDIARIFFKSKKREYIILDAPGHIEFLRNMLSGATRAAGAVLVIDASEGVAENSKRHGLILSLLGIKQIVVAVNKLDMLNYDEFAFRSVKEEYEAYLKSIKVIPAAFVPVSARNGVNVAERSAETPWYKGACLLDALDNFEETPSEEGAFFAMPLQDVYRFSDNNDDRRIYAGSVVSGTINKGEEVCFLPSEKRARIKTVEAWNNPVKERAKMGEAAGFTLDGDIYVRPGEVMLKAGELSPVRTCSRIGASLIWLGREPFTIDKEYLLKLGGAKVYARLERVERYIGERAHAGHGLELSRNDSGSVILRLSSPIALCSFADNASLGRFVIVDGYDAAGAGIVEELLEDAGEEDAKAGFEEELFALLKKYFPHRFKG